MSAQAYNHMRGLSLSPRELEILRYAARGLQDVETGARVHLSINTVKSYKAKIMGKLGAANSAHAVALAYENGILKPGDMAVDDDDDIEEA